MSVWAVQLCVAVGQDVAIHRDRPDRRVLDDLVGFSMCTDRAAGPQLSEALVAR
jgi:hypothetical protein